MENYFKVGDKVTCLLFGKGVVDSVSTTILGYNYPVTVHFDEAGCVCYTADGRYHTYSNVTLFQEGLEIPTLPVNKPIVSFEKGELVWVKLACADAWEARFYSHVDEAGNHHCFNNQRKTGVTSLWIYIRKFEDNPLV